MHDVTMPLKLIKLDQQRCQSATERLIPNFGKWFGNFESLLSKVAKVAQSSIGRFADGQYFNLNHFLIACGLDIPHILYIPLLFYS
jgi:hypothetical protein